MIINIDVAGHKLSRQSDKEFIFWTDLTINDEALKEINQFLWDLRHLLREGAIIKIEN